MSKQGPAIGQIRSWVSRGLVSVGWLWNPKGRYAATHNITQTTPAITNHAKKTTQPGSRFLSELIPIGYPSYVRLLHLSHLSMLERILCPQTEQNLAPRSPAKSEDLCSLLVLESERVHEELWLSPFLESEYRFRKITNMPKRTA